MPTRESKKLRNYKGDDREDYVVFRSQNTSKLSNSVRPANIYPEAVGRAFREVFVTF